MKPILLAIGAALGLGLMFSKKASAATSPLPSPTPFPRDEPSKSLSPKERKAASFAEYLISLESQYGMPKAKGVEDKSLVKEWQSLAGLKADGLVGPSVVYSLAEAGVSHLPSVWYWSKGSNANSVTSFRAKLLELASSAESSGDSKRAIELRASAAREKGQGGITGKVL